MFLQQRFESCRSSYQWPVWPHPINIAPRFLDSKIIGDRDLSFCFFFLFAQEWNAVKKSVILDKNIFPIMFLKMLKQILAEHGPQKLVPEIAVSEGAASSNIARRGQSVSTASTAMLHVSFSSHFRAISGNNSNALTKPNGHLLHFSIDRCLE